MNKYKPSLFFSSLVLAGLVIASALQGQSRPDIVLVLLDDLGFSDIPAYGGEVETPTLDRLAAEGVRFTSFYNSAKCEPTRASLMSGLYWPVTRLNLQRGMTIGQVLQGADYATFAIGKWHLGGNPVNRGFDRYFGHLSGASPFFPPISDTFRLNDQRFQTNDPDWYATDAMTDFAIQFIEESHNADPDKPFFLYLAYNAPHNPLQARRDDIMRYRGRYLEGWDAIREQRHQRQLEMGMFGDKNAPLSPRPVNVPSWDSLTPGQQDLEDLRMSVYAAMVDSVDQNLTRLLARLDELGRSDNLLFLFMSDNGASPFWRTDEIMLARDRLPGDTHSNWEIGLGWANASNTPFRLYKRNQHEGGILTPVIAWYSGGVGNPGGWIHEPSHIIDLMTTFMDVSGAEYPETFNGEPNPPLPGKSLMPLLRGEERASHEALYFLLYDHAAVRMGDWKLARVDGLPWELFNLAEDRTETNDLSKEMPEKAAAMKQRFKDWLVEVGMTHYDNPTPADIRRDDRGGGVKYVPSAMPAHLQYRYPLPGFDPASVPPAPRAQAPAAPRADAPRAAARRAAAEAVQGWTTGRETVRLSEVEGVLRIEALANDPWVVCQLEPAVPSGAPFTLAFEIKAPVADDLRIFSRPASRSGFRAEDTLRVPLARANEWVELQVQLNEDLPLAAIRISPPNHPGVSQLRNIRLLNADGEVLHQWF